MASWLVANCVGKSPPSAPVPPDPSFWMIRNSLSVAYIGVAIWKKYQPARKVGSITKNASRVASRATLRRRRRAMSRRISVISRSLRSAGLSVSVEGRLG